MHLELTPHIRAAFHAVEDALSTVLSDDAQALLIADEPTASGWFLYFTADGLRDGAALRVYATLNTITLWGRSSDRLAAYQPISRGRINEHGDYTCRTPDEDMRAAILPLIAADLVA